ncbi:hypothetical protein AKO1_001960 [Acrasis kona]|uniref:Uncharacterized protein n=1 Tax=Acrasis kona TaxID=1008807 RepID=A0AAW2ZA23_9EUKA
MELHELPFVVHGSEDSLDRDVIYFIDKLPVNKQIIHHFVNENTKVENRNLAVLDPNLGIIVDCYKGTPDSLNNQIIDTFYLHKQRLEQCPVKKRITRNIPLKVCRATRQLIGFVAQSIHHLPRDSPLYIKYHDAIKKSLKSKNLLDRAQCLSTIDFVLLFENNFQIDIWKSLAFQFAQTKAILMDNMELYSKKTVAEYDCRLEPFMYRRTDVLRSSIEQYLSLFNEYRDFIVEYVGDTQVIGYLQFNLLFHPNKYQGQCERGMVIDMNCERAVYKTPLHQDHLLLYGKFTHANHNVFIHNKKFITMNNIQGVEDDGVSYHLYERNGNSMRVVASEKKFQ